MSDQMERQDQTNNRTRNLVLGGLAVIVILSCCLVLTAVGILAIDPFGWNLVDQLFGGVDEAAKAMPADTEFYLGMDMLELTPEKISRVVNPFLAVSDDPDLTDFDRGLDEFDAEMMDELGLTVQDDILPWIGRFGGLGLLNLDIGEFGQPEQVDWSFILSTRDENASDAFLTKLRGAITEESGNSFASSTYESVEIFELNAADEIERVAMARHDGLVIFANSAATIQSNIDAQSGASLADNESFQTLQDTLPGSRALSIFVASSFYQGLQGELTQDLPLEAVPGLFGFLSKSSAAGSLALTEEGLRFDQALMLDPESMSQQQRDLYASMYADQTIDQLLPEVTVAYFSSQRLDLTWEFIREILENELGPEEFNQQMEVFAEEFGINPDTELFPLLDGQWALGVAQSNAGLLAEELSVDFGAAILAHTSDPETLSGNLASFSAALEEQLIPVESVSGDDLTTYTIREDPQGRAMLNFGIGQSHLFISTDNDTTDRIFSDGPSLADSEKYQETWSAFPGGMTPSIYLNMSGLLGGIREGMDTTDLDDFNETARFLQPITTIAGAGESNEQVVHSTFIIFITAVE